MKINEIYIEALKTLNDYVTVSEWAQKVGELYPDILEKAEKEMTFFSTGERYVRHRGGEGSPPMNAPFLTDEERERYRGSYLL